MKVALITGLTGQDGSYLAELLLEKEYQVWGIVRRASDINTRRIDHLYNNKNLIIKYGDMTDGSNLLHIMYEIKDTYPDLDRLEIYNLAAMSHVKVSFEMPEYTADADGIGVLRLLEAIKSSGMKEKCRFYQASTSELYGLVQEVPQKETTPFYPRSPYGVAKLYGYWITKNYRESYNMFACNGILFNHESPRRGETFVTKKITQAVAKIFKGEQDVLQLGNIDAKRDWGYAKDYVEVMWLMLQQDKPEDFVIATGKCYTIREFTEKAFHHVGINITWKGSGVNEVGINEKDGRVLVKINPKYYRPAEVELLLGDATKAKKVLGWESKTSLDEIVKIMVDYDLKHNDYGFD